MDALDKVSRTVVGYNVNSSVFGHKKKRPGSVFTNHSQERSLTFSPRFVNLNVT